MEKVSLFSEGIRRGFIHSRGNTAEALEFIKGRQGLRTRVQGSLRSGFQAIAQVFSNPSRAWHNWKSQSSPWDTVRAWIIGLSCVR